MPYKDPEKAREHAKLRSRKYRQNHPERVKASQKKSYYDNLEKNRAYARAQQKKYRLQNPEKYRAISREFYKTRPEYRMNYNRTKRKEHRARDKLEIFTIYSKRLSNSEIPICNCCGEDKIDFLTIDHIEGKKQMDSDKNIVSLGYNSKMSSYSLYKWILNNNFPDGFQILCTNCNCAKGVFGICPHINSS